jgi:hypothetical protein
VQTQYPTYHPIDIAFANQKLNPVKPTDISATLWLAVGILGPGFGISPNEISARSLRASGVMALLCAHVDTNIIKLLGRWRFDKMLHYLHFQAEPIMCNFASKMLNHGSFVLTPALILKYPRSRYPLTLFSRPLSDDPSPSMVALENS